MEEYLETSNYLPRFTMNKTMLRFPYNIFVKQNFLSTASFASKGKTTLCNVDDAIQYLPRFTMNSIDLFMRSTCQNFVITFHFQITRIIILGLFLLDLFDFFT